MRSNPLIYVAFLALVVASPTILALAYYKITGDPTLRPLALTVEALAGGLEDTRELAIKAQIRVHDPDLHNGPQMARALKDAFEAKGVVSHVYFEQLPEGRPAAVVFYVGSNRIGPFPLSRAASGIQAAVEAYRLTAGSHER